MSLVEQEIGGELDHVQAPSALRSVSDADLIDDSDDSDDLAWSVPHVACGHPTLGTCPLHKYLGATDLQRWEPGRFRMEDTIQVAPRNKARVDHMFDATTGKDVAVKKVPNDWICECHALFAQQYPNATERPWVALGCAALLTDLAYPYVCPLLGVYRSRRSTYIVTELAPERDLFSWLRRCNESPGPARESLVRPLARQIVDAVRILHDLNIVHRDISVENLLVSPRAKDGALQIQLIDFGMSTRSRYLQGGRQGKACYQAPEIHSGQIYDGFVSDAFAVGTVLFGMLTRAYPWSSTRPGCCKAFQFFERHGFGAFAKRKKCFGQNHTVAQCMSVPLLRLLEGLLSIYPSNRFSLGEGVQFDGPERTSVWQETWLHHP
mmetsp:Transcript_18532/g.43679  ORF Transcript_18532/g.43679 Transcript_18532/m.43679 type:complete len:379 (+) Transcript_18532:65-1201(+)